MAIVKEKYQSMSRSSLAKLIGIKPGKLGHNMFLAGLRANEHLGKVCFKEEKEGITIIDSLLLSNYIDQIVLLLNEILDETIPFKEKII